MEIGPFGILPCTHYNPRISLQPQQANFYCFSLHIAPFLSMVVFPLLLR